MQQCLECLTNLLAQLREPLLIASPSGEILAANVASAEALSTSMDLLRGATLMSFSPAPELLAEWLSAPARQVQFPLRGGDGRRFICDTSLLAPDLVLLRLSGGVDPRMRAELLLDDLSSLSGILADLPTMDVGRALLARGMNKVGAYSAGVYLVDQSGDNLELTCMVGYAEESADRYRIVPLTAPLPLVHSFQKGTPVYLGTEEDYAAQYPTLAGVDARMSSSAVACIPLVTDGRPTGVLALGFPLPFHFDEDAQTQLDELARQCAGAFDRTERTDADKVTRVKRSTSQLERLHAFTMALSRAHTSAKVAQVVIDLGMVTTSATTGGLWLRSEDGAAAKLVRGVGAAGPRAEDHENVPLDLPLRMPILDAIRTGTPVWIESCRQHDGPYSQFFSAFSKAGDAGLACLPLLAQGRCIGGLVYTFAGVHPFLEDERAFLLVLARHAAQASERARLYDLEKRAKEAAEADQRRSDFLARAGALLASSLDYSFTPMGVAHAAVPAFADACLIELREDGGERPVAVAAHVDPTRVPLLVALSRQLVDLHFGNPQLYRSVPVDTEPWAGAGIVSAIIVPISARGRTLGGVLLGRAPGRPFDEDDRKAAEELGRLLGLALDNARLFHDVREADRRKDEFLAMLSHELRNPLAPILSAINVMSLSDVDAFASERELITRHLRHLVRLVDDLLDVSRVTRGKIQLDKIRCEVGALIAEAVEMARPLVEERSHRLTVAAPPEGLAVIVDRVRLTQAIGNLLINAATHTEPGGSILVMASAEGSEAVIGVQDSGSGIAPEVLPGIFDLFVQGPGSSDRAVRGLGIGLTVVKSIVEQHAGAVSAQSAGVGRGSSFVVRLPLAPSAAASAPAPAPPEAKAPGSGVRALVVDDNHDAALMLGEELELLGCEVQVAHDGASALATFESIKPELVLLDIGLPDIDGYEVGRRMRQSGHASTRIVAITGYGLESDRARSLEAGFSEHVVKPVFPEDLAAILARCREPTDPR